ncbi:MAG: trypsin-like peptidase domain-containing protein [Clostridia bacterium]|nr:trypsin-like peptidase domain-containing protein [Clostridia bacterium]
MSDFEKLNPTPEEPTPEGTLPENPSEASVETPAERAIPVADPVPVAEPLPMAEVTHTDEAPTETPSEAASDETPVAATEETPAEAPVETPTEAPATPAEPPKTAYRWTYADEASHSTKAKGKGVVVYASIMTAIFLLSFGLLLAVLFLDDSAGYHGLLRPGITETENDNEAVAGVEQAKHSVVVIEVRTEAGGGTGTGIIMTSDGYIATNHHVIEGATRIKVTFYDGTVMEAETVGSSEMDDLGVIKVQATGLPAATFAHSEDCYVGQTVYAIGTPAGADFGWTTTKGIISYTNREVKIYDEDDGTLQKKLRLLQTDAMVNPGNSGGPLINTKGEVVGVVSMKLSNGYEGIGFAIPSDGAVEILEAIMEFGNADNINSSLHHKRPMLGVTGVYMDAGEYYLPNETGVERIPEEKLGEYDVAELIHPAVSGVYVMGFADGMDAAEKMEVGDIITACQGEEVTSMNALSSVVNDYYAGDTVTLTVYRDGKHIAVDIVLSAQPDT